MGDEQRRSRFFLSAMFLTTLIVYAVLLGACNNSKPSQDVAYENERYGFSLSLPDSFAKRVDVREEGNFIYFVDQEVQSKHPEHVFGIVSRIEVYDKKEFVRDQLREFEGMYGFRYLGESDSHYFGWAHATDVQVLPDASKKTLQDFRDLEKEFDKIISSFTLKKNTNDVYSLLADNQPVTLGRYYNEEELGAILGKPVFQIVEALDSTADTYAGSFIKTLKYEGLVMEMFSPRDDGKNFWLMSVDTTSANLCTPRGISAGSTLGQLKKAYSAIEIAPDGRTDANNCAYRIGGAAEYKNITFEVEKGIVSQIKMSVVFP